MVRGTTSQPLERLVANEEKRRRMKMTVLDVTHSILHRPGCTSDRVKMEHGFNPQFVVIRCQGCGAITTNS